MCATATITNKNNQRKKKGVWRESENKSYYHSTEAVAAKGFYRRSLLWSDTFSRTSFPAHERTYTQRFNFFIFLISEENQLMPAWRIYFEKSWLTINTHALSGARVGDTKETLSTSLDQRRWWFYFDRHEKETIFRLFGFIKYRERERKLTTMIVCSRWSFSSLRFPWKISNGNCKSDSVNMNALEERIGNKRTILFFSPEKKKSFFSAEEGRNGKEKKLRNVAFVKIYVYREREREKGRVWCVCLICVWHVTWVFCLRCKLSLIDTFTLKPPVTM